MGTLIHNIIYIPQHLQPPNPLGLCNINIDTHLDIEVGSTLWIHTQSTWVLSPPTMKEQNKSISKNRISQHIQQQWCLKQGAGANNYIRMHQNLFYYAQ